MDQWNKSYGWIWFEGASKISIGNFEIRSLASSSSANPLSPFTGVCSPASLENRYANMVASISQVLYSK
ncbi:uncharacterized protein G2W53_039058 [Senna tora]|uniref:Uncharacterized protein n=1 Tax=Senna tora TaxID=362788 RepID=A0A834SSS1_9FABA|nr:uncharacterized protein G2W53_039058 [Senna tora]